MSLVVMFTLIRFVFFMKFFELVGMSPLRNKRVSWLGNICSYSASLKQFSWTKITPLHWSGTIAQQCHVWIFGILEKVFNSTHCSLSLAICLWIIGAGGDVMKSVSFGKLSHFCGCKLWPIVTNKGYRDAIPCKDIGLRKEMTLEVVVDWSCCTSTKRE